MGINNQEDILVLIARNFADLADASEIIQLNLWIESSEDNKRYYEQVKNIWDTSNKRIDLYNIDTNKALKNVHRIIHKGSTKRSFWFYWQKIAAVLILLLIIGTLLWISIKSNIMNTSSNKPVYNEVHAAFGTRSALRLEDSTLVWLNSGSSLKYPVKFDNKNRKVFLIGEAYFEVESDVAKPFIVETQNLQIKATGTKFNVQEYVSNPIAEVTLVSGKVVVNESNTNNSFKLISELNPNQHLDYNSQTKEKFIIEEDTYKYIGWKDGKLIFRNEPLDKVLSKLSVMFNVDIDLQGEELQKYRYHATFQDESLEEILKLLKLSAPLSFKEVKRNPLPDGSFPKKKVIIFPVNKQYVIN